MRSVKPVEKRGGMRKTNKRRPRKVGEKSGPQDYFKERKGKSIFPKKLGQYRFVICTDLETDDIAYLTLFAAWLKVNEQFYDDRNNFPIYGFVVGETPNPEVKVARVREYLAKLGELTEWDNPEHHLYKRFMSCGGRVWVDGVSNNKFEGEDTLLERPDAVGQASMLVENIDNLLQVKPDKLIYVHLKPMRFLSLFAERPDVLEFMRRSPAIVYGSWNCRMMLPDNKESLLRYLNRGPNDAPLLYTESFAAFGEQGTATPDNCKKLFAELDAYDDGTFPSMMKNTMLAWNDVLKNRQVSRFESLPEFADTDFDSLDSFNASAKKFVATETQRRQLNILKSIIQYDSLQFTCADILAFIAMLIGSGTLTDTPFKLERSTLSVGQNNYISQIASDNSNTRVLLPTTNLSQKHVDNAKRLVQNILVAAFTILEGT